MKNNEFKTLLQKHAPNMPDSTLQDYVFAFDNTRPFYVKLDLGNETNIFVMHNVKYIPWVNDPDRLPVKIIELVNGSYIQFPKGQVEFNGDVDYESMQSQRFNNKEMQRQALVKGKYALNAVPDTDFTSPDTLYFKDWGENKLIHRSNIMSANVNRLLAVDGKRSSKLYHQMVKPIHKDFMVFESIVHGTNYGMQTNMPSGSIVDGANNGIQTNMEFGSIVDGVNNGIKGVHGIASLLNTTVLKAFGADENDVQVIQNSVLDYHFSIRQDMMIELNSSLRSKLIEAYTLDEKDPLLGLKKAEYAFDHYPMNVLNFIVGAEAVNDLSQETVMKYRRQFMETLIDMVDYPSEQKPWGGNEHTSTIDGVLNQRILSIFENNYQKNILIKEIDKGKYSYQTIAKKLGVEHIHYKQFKSAFKSYHPLKDSLALAKIPEEWVTRVDENGDKVNMLLDVSNFMDFKYPSLNGLSGEDGADHFRRYLIATGKYLAVLDERAAKLDKFNYSPAEIKLKTQEIKVEKAKTLSQWEWLSRKKDPVVAFKKFNLDYKIKKTIQDYKRQIDIFMDAVVNRVIYEHSACESSEWFSVNERLAIDYETDAIDRGMDAYDRENFENDQYDLSDNDPYKNEEYSSDEINFNYGGINLKEVWNLKDIANKNIELHKVIPGITKKMGDYATGNVEWVGITNEDFVMGDYTFEPISDRRRLLKEGAVQDHCVYIYLPQCLQGEISIVSIKDNRDQRVVGTLEIKQNIIEEDENGNDIYEHENMQLQGPNNDRVSSDVSDAVNVYLARLNNQVGVVVNNIDDENKNHEDFDLSIEEAANMNVVPFLTDAVFDAYGLLSDYLPNGVTVNDVIQLDHGLSNVFYTSPFGKTLSNIDCFSKTFNVPIKDVLENRKKWPIDDVIGKLDIINYNKHTLLHTQERLKNLSDLDPIFIDDEVSKLISRLEDISFHDDSFDVMHWVQSEEIEIKGLLDEELHAIIKNPTQGLIGYIKTNNLQLDQCYASIKDAITKMVSIIPPACDLGYWLKNDKGELKAEYEKLGVTELFDTALQKQSKNVSLALVSDEIGPISLRHAKI